MTQAQLFRRAILRAAQAEWTRPVVSTTAPGARRITEAFRAIGWGWVFSMLEIDGYSEEARRAHPGLLNYCGVGLGAAGLRAGLYWPGEQCVNVRLHPGVATYCLPSTLRMLDPTRWESAGVLMPDHVDHDDVGECDIITVATTGRRPGEGDHFAIVEAVDGQWLHTIEWNATGELPDGSQGRGVVKRRRHIDDLRVVHRLDERHIQEV